MPPSKNLLLLGLPQTQPTDVASILRESSRSVTASRSDAAREKVQISLRGSRLGAVARVLTDYIPYATACADIADGLRARGKLRDREPFHWKSSLAPSSAAAVSQVSGGFSVELVFVVSAAALNRLHVALSPEGRTMLASDQIPELLAASKELQVAAGMYTWLADVGIPRALESLSAPPSPELDPHVARAMQQLCLAVAQCLVVRNAELSGLPPGSLAKLALGAQALCVRAADAAMLCGKGVSGAVCAVSVDIGRLMRGWSQALLAKATGHVGDRLGRIRMACEDARKLAGRGGVVSQLAGDWLVVYSSIFDEYEGDARRNIEPESRPEALGTSRMETKVIVKESPYEPPKAQTVKKSSTGGTTGAGDDSR